MGNAIINIMLSVLREHSSLDFVNFALKCKSSCLHISV